MLTVYHGGSLGGFLGGFTSTAVITGAVWDGVKGVGGNNR